MKRVTVESAGTIPSTPTIILANCARFTAASGLKVPSANPFTMPAAARLSMAVSYGEVLMSPNPVPIESGGGTLPFRITPSSPTAHTVMPAVATARSVLAVPDVWTTHGLPPRVVSRIVPFAPTAYPTLGPAKQTSRSVSEVTAGCFHQVAPPSAVA